SFFSFTVTRTNATRDPSGETCGSPIQTKSQRSFSVILRFCAKATLIPVARMSRQMTKHELRMAKEWRSPKLEVQDRLRFIILSFVIISNFVIRISSFCSHVSDHVAAKLATFDFRRAFHQASEIV